VGAGSSRSRAAVARSAQAITNSQAAEGNLPEGNGAAVGNLPEGNGAAEGNPPEGNGEQFVNSTEADVMEDEVMTEADVNDGVTNPDPVVVRDAAVERELADALTGDAFDDYDIDVSDEGQAIAEYLSLLESAASS
jgi:hypothetical protein